MKAFFFLPFFFSYKDSKKNLGVRRTEEGHLIELSVHRPLQCLLGVSSEGEGPICLVPLFFAEVPCVPERLSSKEVWHFFFFFFLLDGEMKLWGGGRIEKRRQTQTGQVTQRRG